MILAPATVFWLVCLAGFVGTLLAAVVLAGVWVGHDVVTRTRRARRHVPAGGPVVPGRTAARPPGRHHSDPSVTSPLLLRGGPSRVDGSPPWDFHQPRTTSPRPTLKGENTK